MEITQEAQDPRGSLRQWRSVSGHIRHQASYQQADEAVLERELQSQPSHVNWVVLCKAYMKNLRAEKIGALGPCVNNLQRDARSEEAVLSSMLILVNAVAMPPGSSCGPIVEE